MRLLKNIFVLWLIFTTMSLTTDGQIITTIAGSGAGGPLGDGGPATAASLGLTPSIAIDKVGNIYIADGNHYRIRKVSAATGIITTVAGTGVSGFSDNIPATNAMLNLPGYVNLDTAGNLYIGDANNYRIRKVDIGTGIISTFLGNGVHAYSLDGSLVGPSTSMLTGEFVFDDMNIFYINDLWMDTSIIRKVDASGLLNTIAGGGSWGGFGDGGPATAARFKEEFQLCTDRYRNVYIADNLNKCVRKINVTTGFITRVAGTGDSVGMPYSGDGGPATAAHINPEGIVIDTSGNLFISDALNERIEKVDVYGIIHSIAGTGIAGFSGDGGPATAAQFYIPRNLAFDPCGNLYVADWNNKRVRKIAFNTTTTDTPNIVLTAITTSPICAGTTVTYTATTAGGGSTTNYSWYINSTAVSGATGSSYTYAPAAGDTVRCGVVTFNACSLPAMAKSNGIALTVNPVVTPTIAISITPNDTVCAGTAVTLSASIANGGTTPTYQWYKNGVVITSAATYSYTPDNNDSVRCVLTSSAACATTTMAGSNTITLTVNPVVTPDIAISVSPNDTVCAGTVVTLTAATANGGITPAYQWYKNGAVISATPTYTYTPANNDSVRCVLTSSEACSTTTVANSNTITLTVNPIVTPTISINPSPNDTVCAGTVVTYTATITDGGSIPIYRWFKNGALVSGAASYSYTPANYDSVRCTLLSNAACAVPTLVAATVNMTVNPMVTPTIAITASPNDTVCEGIPVTYTATITNGGTAPTYRWYKNGALVTTSAAYGYTPATGDSVRCVLVSSAPCATTLAAGSNTINMVVNPLVTPLVSIGITPNDTVCTGTAVALVATPANGGPTPSYQWQVNGTAAGGSSIHSYIPANGDIVDCRMFTSAACATTSIANSNTITITVDTFAVPTITITGVSVAAIGSTVTVTATLANAGSSYVIHWIDNGTEFTTTTIPTVSYTKTQDTDVITARIVSTDVGCYDSTTSAELTITKDHTGIADYNVPAIKIYPNPACDLLTVEAPNIYTITITDLLGKLYVRSHYTHFTKAVVDLKELPRGVYIIKVNDVVGRVVKE